MHVFSTAFGPCGIDYGDAGITRVRLLASKVRASVPKPPRPIVQTGRSIERYFGGSREDFGDVVLDTRTVPPFHRKVYDLARALGWGDTVSYGEAAERVGSPGGSRAVGQAMAKNPFMVIVPCHRILAGKSRIGGFSAPGGTSTKEKMLAIEGVVAGLPPIPLPFDADAATRHITSRDPVLGAHIERVGPFRIRLEPAPSLFFVLGRSIVYQQLSGKAASTIHARYRMLFDGAMPTPEGLAKIPDAKLRGAGISGNKALALRDLARRSGELPTMRALGKMNDEEVIESLISVRGIGRWTVQMVLMFRLGRPDVLPVDDYGVRKGFQKVYGLRELPTAERMTKQAEKWAPYRSVGSWYMWRALE